tara:strand:- start:2149 stop:2448 length:300 start_codon:yes stop_codon:yes gene_type:complete
MKYVFIREEYGYRYWVSQIDETQVDTIKNWWINLESVLSMFFSPEGKMPISITELTAENENEFPLTMESVAIYIDLHEDNDSSLKVIGDKTYYHKGYQH